MTEKPELKPCPFCGGSNIEIREHFCGDGYFRIQCNNNECCAVLDDFSSKEAAIALWNRRPEAPPAPRETLQKIIAEMENIEPLFTQCEYERGFLQAKNDCLSIIERIGK